MRIRESTRLWVLTGALIFFSAVSPSFAKEVYKWVDEKGTVHFSEDQSRVPEEYRDQAEKKSIPEEVNPLEEKARAKKQEKTKDRPGAAEKERVNKNKIEGHVIESVKTILSLWKEEKYSLLFDHGNRKSRRTVSREDFERRMRKKGIRLAPSWETIRDIEVDVRNSILAYATVKIGLRPISGRETKFRTETYRMSFEKGMWKIDLTKLLSVKIHE